MGEMSTIISLFFFLDFVLKTFDHSFLNVLDLTAQLESLRSAADHAAGFINAKGAILVVRLHDIPNRVREVALHGVRHRAAMALAAAQACSGHNLWLLPSGFLEATYPGEHERLVEDFMSARVRDF